VVRLVDDDAGIEGLERSAYAKIASERIAAAIATYRASRTREALIASAWRAAAATVVAAVVLLVLFWGLRALRALVERRYRERVKTLTISSFEVLRAERIWAVVRGVVRLLAAVAAIGVVVTYLRYALGQFPWTRAIALDVAEWVVAPLRIIGAGLLARIPDLIFLAVLFLIVRYVLRVLYAFFSAAGRGEVDLKGFDPDWAEPTYKIVRLGLIAFALVVAYPYIPGSSSAAFQGVSIFLGILLSLGSSSAIANVIAGYTMIYRKAFREGDVIRIADTFGYVSTVRLQVTHLRTPKNEEVIIPNSTILAGEVINYSTLAKTEGLILHTTVGIGYETPWRQVEAMLIEAAERTPLLLKDPKPYVLERQLGDFAVTYEINAYCAEPRTMHRTYAELHRHILDVFNEYGVQIMTPAYEGDPEVPKLVPKDRMHLPPAKQP
jgi:small-conductance mechanosensitive channel